MAPAARRTPRGSEATGPGSRLLAQQRTHPALTRRQLGLEPLELCLARAHELELVGDVLERLLQDLPLLGGVVGVLPALAQSGARGLGLDEPLQVVEREPEQVAQADQLPEPLDVLARVQPPLARDAVRDLGKQADLLVVADRARRRAR